MAESDLKEPAFGLNNFGKPRVLMGPEVVVQSVLMVLFGKPGCFPSIPELGMNIQRYRMQQITGDLIEEIHTTLHYQCGLLQAGIIEQEISVQKGITVNNDPVLLIVVPVSDQDERFNIIVGIGERNNQVIYNWELVNSMLML